MLHHLLHSSKKKWRQRDSNPRPLEWQDRTDFNYLNKGLAQYWDPYCNLLENLFDQRDSSAQKFKEDFLPF